MKHRLLYTLLTLCLPLLCSAQSQQDFASIFMARHAENSALSCATVSPTMMEKVMQLDADKADKDTRKISRSLKSCRIVTCKNQAEADDLYNKALTLVRNNAGRYKPFDKYDGKQLYVRRRGKSIVELILLTNAGGTLTIVDLTGTMDENFVKQLSSDNETKR